MAGGNTKGLAGAETEAVLPARRGPMLDAYEDGFARKVRSFRASDAAIANMLGRSEDSVRRWREAEEARGRGLMAISGEGGQ